MKSTFENYEKETLYEFTINMHDDYQCPCDEDRIMKCRKWLKDRMDLNTWNYHCRTEISELHHGHRSGGITRVHFHGLIYFKTNEEIYYFLNTQLNKIFKIGSVCINAYRPSWLDYIRKQKHIIPKELLVCANIKLDHLLKTPKDITIAKGGIP